MFFLRSVYFSLLIVLALSSSYGQINLDSIKSVLDETPSDTVSINKVITQGYRYRKINLDASLLYFEWAVRQSHQVNDQSLLCKSLIALGANYNLTNDFGSAAANLIEGMRIAEKLNDKQLILKGYIGLGNMYAYSKQITFAKGIYLKGLKLAEEIGSEIDQATLLNNIGAITYRESYLDAVHLRLSCSYFLKALVLLEKVGQKEPLIDKYNNLGLLYCDMGKPDSALIYLEKSKEIIKEFNQPDYLITYYNYLGRVYEAKKDFAKAEEAYMNSLKESKNLNDDDWVYENYLSMAGLYESKEDFKNAFEYYRRYSLLKDSVTNESNFAEASDIKNKFEREKKEAELNQLRAEQSKQKIFNIALILVSILTVISGIMMYSRFKIKAESEKKLKLQNEIISEKNKDITDSIIYARKIQQSILPSEKQLEKELKRLIKRGN
jgi:tetratricopeptide (TPR) repeat protein